MTLFYSLIFISVSFLSCSNSEPERFIFFLHNRFLETHSLEDFHPEYGRVEYLEILSAFRKENFTVISNQRQGTVNARTYATTIVSQINELLKKGVKPSHITIVGTSKGGYIAQYVSSLAHNPDLNFVFIGCFRTEDIEQLPDINYCGNILTIYEKSDLFGVSANARINLSTCTITQFKELELNTGLGHGFLFKALDAWIHPTITWANGNYENP